MKHPYFTRWERCLAFALAACIVLTLAAARADTRARVCRDTVRLHILADSDTVEDQLLKLQVRDAVLAALPPAVSAQD